MNTNAPLADSDLTISDDQIVASIRISRDVTKVWTGDGEEHFVTTESFQNSEYLFHRGIATESSRTVFEELVSR